MKTKYAAGIIVLFLLIASAIIIGWNRLSPPNYPEDTLYDKVTYIIDPEKLPTSLAHGEEDMFLLVTEESNDPWPLLRAPGSLAWNDEVFMRVANSLHEYVWSESLDYWKLIRAAFQINQCQNIVDRIDNASLSFYKRQQDRVIVHGFWIRPLYGYITAGNQYSDHANWIADWKDLDLERTKINNVDSALAIAENNGGREIRQATQYQCRISILLAPDRFEYDFVSNPLNHYGWGWSVIYWPSESNADPLFSIVIDPYTGKYKIQN